MKSAVLSQKAASASRVNPMRYVNALRAESVGQRAASLSHRADELSQLAARFGDVSGFGRSLSGQTVQSVSSNVVSNNLTYATGDFQEHSVGGYVRASLAGLGVGVLSPRVTPLRQRMFDVDSSAGFVQRGLTQVSGFGVDRGMDFGLGVGNYVVTPQKDSFSWQEASAEGFKSAVSGGAGSVSGGVADNARSVGVQDGGE